jgi:hypothetical protein
VVLPENVLKKRRGFTKRKQIDYPYITPFLGSNMGRGERF